MKNIHVLDKVSFYSNSAYLKNYMKVVGLPCLFAKELQLTTAVCCFIKLYIKKGIQDLSVFSLSLQGFLVPSKSCVTIYITQHTNDLNFSKPTKNFSLNISNWTLHTLYIQIRTYTLYLSFLYIQECCSVICWFLQSLWFDS